jgi:16S rRNA (guanine527-N7)-methyltransferase
MNKTEFISSVNDIFKNIDSNFFSNIEKYKDFLNEVNEHTNLTRLDSPDKIYGEYFYESIIPYKDVDFAKIQSLLDIGSGSGIPGIVLKLLYPHIELTIIEANNKKCTFLKSLCEKLNIDVQILNQRAENIQKNQREYFDLVTSRAVAPLPFIIEISLPYVKVGGFMIEPKSSKVIAELEDVNKIIQTLGGKFLAPKNFVSINQKTHIVITIEKIKPTNHQYPRN